jgi:hypothetical protein
VQRLSPPARKARRRVLRRRKPAPTCRQSAPGPAERQAPAHMDPSPRGPTTRP